jgi:redox-sensing transcriptional repressor
MLKETKEVSKASPKFGEPTLRRLPIYHHYLKKVEELGIKFISSTQLAAEFSSSPVQVRKDLEVTGTLGKPKIGYEVSSLINAIEQFFGWKKLNLAVLVGAGHLGYALLGYQGFKDYGLNIVAAFDADPEKISKTVHSKKIYHTDALADFVKKHKLEIGILTAPASVAQELADKMTRAGIKAIWNFAPARIAVKKGVIIQHENLASSLAVLFKKLVRKH